MATTPTSTTNLQEGYKYQYDDRARLLINKSARTLKKVKVSPRKPSGRGFMLGIETQASYNIKVRDENEDMGDSNSREGLQNPLITAKNLYAVTSLSGQAVAAAQNYTDGFIKTKQYCMDQLIRTYHKLNNWHFFGNGEGTLATIASVSGTTLTLSSPDYGYALKKGMIIDIVTPSGTTVHKDQATIQTVANDKQTVVVDNATSAVATDEIVLAGDRDSTVDKHLTGMLAAIVTSGSYFGVNVATYDEWAGQRLNNDSALRPLTIALLQLALDTIEFGTGEENPDIEFVVNHGVRRKYMLLLHPQKRLVNTQKLSGGYTELDFNGIQFRADTDARREKVFLIDWDTWRKYQLKKPGWGDEEGIWLSMLRGSAGKDAIQATYIEYMDIGCDGPKFNCIIDDVSES